MSYSGSWVCRWLMRPWWAVKSLWQVGHLKSPWVLSWAAFGLQGYASVFCVEGSSLFHCIHTSSDDFLSWRVINGHALSPTGVNVHLFFLEMLSGCLSIISMSNQLPSCPQLAQHRTSIYLGRQLLLPRITWALAIGCGWQESQESCAATWCQLPCKDSWGEGGWVVLHALYKESRFQRCTKEQWECLDLLCIRDVLLQLDRWKGVLVMVSSWVVQSFSRRSPLLLHLPVPCFPLTASHV